MIEKEMAPGDIERKVHDLAQAMNRVRTAQADRDDVVVEMKHAKLSRLELLAEDLSPVFDDVPEDNEQFEFSVTNGEVPRLWIDMTSFVRMGPDGREYEFVKDTRMGRTILGRNTSRKKMGEQVTAYIAERILERERMIEGDWISMAQLIADRKTEAADELRSSQAANDVAVPADGRARYSALALFSWFMLGLAAGALVLLGLVWFELFDDVLRFLPQR